MRSPSIAPPILRASLVVVVAVCAFAASTWALLTALADMTDLILGPGRASVDELVIAVSAAGALVLLLWVALGLLASVLAALPGPAGDLGRRARDAIAPEAVRRCAALLLGVAVVSACGPGGAAAAEVGTVRSLAGEVSSPAPAPLWVASETPAAPALDPTPAVAPAPAWTPLPVRDLPPVTLTAPRPEVEPERPVVTVHPGDTLWDLAAAHLSPEATDAEIATAWHRWWEENRDVIGPDPDHILPGQLLTVPATASTVTAGAR